MALYLTWQRGKPSGEEPTLSMLLGLPRGKGPAFNTLFGDGSAFLFLLQPAGKISFSINIASGQPLAGGAEFKATGKQPFSYGPAFNLPIG